MLEKRSFHEVAEYLVNPETRVQICLSYVHVREKTSGVGDQQNMAFPACRRILNYQSMPGLLPASRRNRWTRQQQTVKPGSDQTHG